MKEQVSAQVDMMGWLVFSTHLNADNDDPVNGIIRRRAAVKRTPKGIAHLGCEHGELES